MRRAFFFLLVASCSAGEIAVATSSPSSSNVDAGDGFDASHRDAPSDLTKPLDTSPVPPRVVVATGEVYPYLVASDGAYV